MKCGKVICVLVVASVILIMIVFVDVSYGDRAGRDCFYNVVQGLPTLGNSFTIFKGSGKSIELSILKQETGTRT